MDGAKDGAAAEMDAAEEGQVLKGDLAAFARLSNEQQRQLHTLDLSRTYMQRKDHWTDLKELRSLAPALKHLKLLQSLNLTSKQQGSGGCRGLGWGGRGWYLRGGPVAALCSVGVLGAGAWCVCAGVWGF